MKFAKLFFCFFISVSVLTADANCPFCDSRTEKRNGDDFCTKCDKNLDEASEKLTTALASTSETGEAKEHQGDLQQSTREILESYQYQLERQRRKPQNYHTVEKRLITLALDQFSKKQRDQLKRKFAKESHYPLMTMREMGILLELYLPIALALELVQVIPTTDNNATRMAAEAALSGHVVGYFRAASFWANLFVLQQADTITRRTIDSQLKFIAATLYILLHIETSNTQDVGKLQVLGVIMHKLNTFAKTAFEFSNFNQSIQSILTQANPIQPTTSSPETLTLNILLPLTENSIQDLPQPNIETGENFAVNLQSGDSTLERASFIRHNNIFFIYLMHTNLIIEISTLELSETLASIRAALTQSGTGYAIIDRHPNAYSCITIGLNIGSVTCWGYVAWQFITRGDASVHSMLLATVLLLTRIALPHSKKP